MFHLHQTYINLNALICKKIYKWFKSAACEYISTADNLNP